MITPLTLPNHASPLLLHSCCAPCAHHILHALVTHHIACTLFFYNPNIHPHSEYTLRKQANQRLANQLGLPFIDADYDPDLWFTRTQGLEAAKERGPRCEICFDLRLERTAHYAHTHGFPIFTSSLGSSRWKKLSQINRCGLRAANRYPGLIYWTYPWRQTPPAPSPQPAFYRQSYCGCQHSLRDHNRRATPQPKPHEEPHDENSP